MAEPIRCLTLWQPWASLLASGTKRYETRSWSTPYRGLLAIHAAKRWAGAERLAWQRAMTQLVSRSTGDRIAAAGAGFWAAVGPCDLPLGAIVGLGQLASCELMDQALIESQDEDELAFGDWRPGRYAWRIEQVIRLPEPIPLKGRQGMWTLSEDVASLVREQAGVTL